MRGDKSRVGEHEVPESYQLVTSSRAPVRTQVDESVANQEP